MNVPNTFFLVAILAACGFTEAALSTKRRCFDEKCSVPISWGRTLTMYAAPEAGMLSFRPNNEVTIYSKEAGSNTDLWGVEVNGKRGYVPRNLVKELKVFNKNAEYIVDVEPDTVQPNVPLSKSEQIIIDGTTIYNEIAPSATLDASTQAQATHIPGAQQQSKESVIIADEGKSDGVGVAGFVAQETNEVVGETQTKTSDNVETKETIDIKQIETNDNQQSETKEQQIEDTEDDDDIEVESEDDEEEDNDDDEEEDENEDEFPEVEIKQENVDISNLKTELNTSTDVKGEPGKLPESYTEAPPTVAPPTKLPLFFHHKDPGKPAETSPEFIENEVKVAITSEETKPEVPETLPVSENEVDYLVASDNIENVSTKPETLQKLETPNNPFGNLESVTPSSEEVTSIPVYAEGPPLQDSQSFDGLEATGHVYEPVVPVYGEEEKDLPVREEPSFLSSLFGSSEITSEEVVTPPVASNNFETTAPSIDSETIASKFESDVTPAPSIEEVLETTLAPSVGEVFETTQAPSVDEAVDITTAPSLEKGDTIQESSDFAKTTPEISTNDKNIFDKTSDWSDDLGWRKKLEEMTPKVEVTTEEPSIANADETSSTTEPSYFDTTPSTSPKEFEDGLSEDLKVDQSVANSSNDEEVKEPEIPIGNGWLSSMNGYFGTTNKEKQAEEVKVPEESVYNEVNDDVLLSQFAHNNRDSCPADGDNAHCHPTESTPAYTGYPAEPEMQSEQITEAMTGWLEFIPLEVNDTLIIVAITGACVVLFLWGAMIIEKLRKEGPLVGKINHLEQQLLLLAKENEVLGAKLEDKSHQSEINENESISSELVEGLQQELDVERQSKLVLEEQIASLEKELENSTEVGLELNKMLSDVLSSQNGSDALMANIEQLQKQLVEQQSTINSVNDKLNEKDTENHELQLDLEITTKKVVDLQAELEKMMLNHLKAEEEKEAVVTRTESEITELRDALSKTKATYKAEVTQLGKQLADAQTHYADAQRLYEVKSKEYDLLRSGLANSDSNQQVVEQSVLKAELQQLQQDNKALQERLGNAQVVDKNYQSEVKQLGDEKAVLRKQYEEADKEKLEALTKLEVLSAYFKEKEAELQAQLAKHEALWSEKQGESTTASERLRFMQEEIQNFKSQVASLQQEIVSQEVDLKSQISVLEKKAHENWVAARQAERRIEDARQEAAQLRNRLTLRERGLVEEKTANRNGMSPLETNGVDHHINDTASPPLLFGGGRDHLTTSPPLIPGLPPGFPLPPPPGVPPPFLPPPFMAGMPPPPPMFPGDHRPPPLGRMSSPPVGGGNRYTPDSRGAFSPYDRRSPSPTDDDYYDHYDRHYDRGYDRRSKRNGRRSAYSSGSNSAESLDKMDRHSHSKV